ncbi:Pectate lyase superfamily protein [Paenibacillus algorifonticola]|uniref:Pectate lyase superfamily protein n=1 Tax=Paenibacillus algorifonticola TaxID=684063 RepID=A0A1I2GHL1_9BACL|nr:right-handed parallel beta-helix repeat-containing protein [Paenibacillus algorifonticola]SFF16480.1 Pectate lyase superfamily protein [Paenibacillus algorifonticola]
MTTNKTPNLSLSDCVGTDGVARTEMNVNFESIDAEFAQRGTNLLWKDADPTGATDSSAALLSAIVEDSDTIIVPKGIYALHSSVSIPATKRLVFDQNARFRPKKNITLTVNGPVDADAFDWIFDLTLGGKIAGYIKIDTIYPQWFGAKADNMTNDYLAIQNAEDIASTSTATVVFAGEFAISASIIKKSNSHWFGYKAKLRRIDNADPSGMGFTLVYAPENTRTWSIRGMEFEAIDHGTRLLKNIKTGFSPSKNNSCIDAYHSHDWYIKDCVFRKFSQGIIYRGCSNFVIKDNSFYSDTGKTIASMLDGTYQPFGTYAYTGAIVFGHLGASPEPRKASNFMISDNYMEVMGLDLGIDALAQTYDENPCIISRNIILGAQCSIQVYRGSYADPLTAETYRGNIQIDLNRLYASWEQAIYIRGTNSIVVSNNYIEYAAQKPGGNADGAGSSVGAIVTRVNPFKTEPHSPLPSDQVGIDIFNNRIVNPGRNNHTIDGAIHIKIPNCRVVNNDIIREKVKFPNLAPGPAIIVDNSESLLNADIRGNRIDYFQTGILWAGSPKEHTEVEKSSIEGNIIKNCAGEAITLDTFRVSGTLIRSNRMHNCTLGLSVRNSPYTTVEDNHFNRCTKGIELRPGNLASDYIPLKSGKTYTGVDTGLAGGGTIIVRNNDFVDVDTPHLTTGTTGNDFYFHGRCALWEGDRINSRPLFPNQFAAAVPSATYTARIWHKHDRIQSTTLASGQVYEKICIQPGMYGKAPTKPLTCTVTNGSAIATNVTSVANIGRGQYLLVGDSVKYVLAVDYNTNRITFDSVFTASASSVAIALSPPQFVNLIVCP